MKICFKNNVKPYQNQKKVKYEQVYCGGCGPGAKPLAAGRFL